MNTISVKKSSGSDFHVIVESTVTTQHTVTVEDGYYQKITQGKVSKEDLVRASFDFLLEREPNTSILGRFDLPVISRYFHDYERVIKRYL